jgi:hypothetical protein
MACGRQDRMQHVLHFLARHIMNKNIVKETIRRVLPRRIRSHRILGGPFKGKLIVTSLIHYKNIAGELMIGTRLGIHMFEEVLKKYAN